MMERLSYQTKNKYLLAGTLAFGLLVYLLAIQPTLQLWQQNREQQKELALAQQAPAKIRALEERLATLQTRLGAYLITESDNQEKIVQIANSFCQQHGLILREIPVLQVEKNNQLEVVSTRIVAQGAFVNLLKMVYFFEQQHKMSRVTSVSFEKTEDMKTRKSYLAVHILLQNIRITK